MKTSNVTPGDLLCYKRGSNLSPAKTFSVYQINYAEWLTLYRKNTNHDGGSIQCGLDEIFTAIQIFPDHDEIFVMRNKTGELVYTFTMFLQLC